MVPKGEFRHTEAQVEVRGQQGHTFRLVLRQARLDPLDFSAIMLYVSADGADYILRRHNGPHPSRHTNKFEKERKLANSLTEIGPLIHMATQRYQEAGLEIDGYALPTAKFSDFESALTLLLEDTTCVAPESPPDPGNPRLFP